MIHQHRKHVKFTARIQNELHLEFARIVIFVDGRLEELFYLLLRAQVHQIIANLDGIASLQRGFHGALQNAHHVRADKGFLIHVTPEHLLASHGKVRLKEGKALPGGLDLVAHVPKHLLRLCGIVHGTDLHAVQRYVEQVLTLLFEGHVPTHAKHDKEDGEHRIFEIEKL